MDLREARKHWQALHDAWAEAETEARSARSVCTAKFRGGVGPDIPDLDRAEALEARANELRDQMDAFTGEYFGE